MNVFIQLGILLVSFYVFYFLTINLLQIANGKYGTLKPMQSYVKNHKHSAKISKYGWFSSFILYIIITGFFNLGPLASGISLGIWSGLMLLILQPDNIKRR